MTRKYTSSEVSDLIAAARLQAREKQIERSGAIMQGYADKIALLEHELEGVRLTVEAQGATIELTEKALDEARAEVNRLNGLLTATEKVADAAIHDRRGALSHLVEDEGQEYPELHST
jgi:hypothetical protein